MSPTKRILDRLTITFLILTLLTAALYMLAFINPRTSAQPERSSTIVSVSVNPTSTPKPTRPATWTPTPAWSATPIRTHAPSPTTSQVEQLPDVVVDPANLSEHRYVCEHDEARIRVSVGIANIGAGPLHLFAHPRNRDIIFQRIYQSDGETHDINVSAGFEFHATHNHVHFSNWVHMRIVRRDRDCIDSVIRNAQYCILAQSQKIGFCLLDEVLFDGIRNAAWGWMFSSGVCRTLNQGISPGLKDVYEWYLDDQHIDISQLAAGDYYLEVEVDPHAQIMEANRDNNITRISVTLPDSACK